MIRGRNMIFCVAVVLTVVAGALGIWQLPARPVTDRDLSEGEMAALFGKQMQVICYNCFEYIVYPNDCDFADPCLYCLQSGDCNELAWWTSGLTWYYDAYALPGEPKDWYIESGSLACAFRYSCTAQDFGGRVCNIIAQNCDLADINDNCRRCIRGNTAIQDYPKTYKMCVDCPDD